MRLFPSKKVMDISTERSKCHWLITSRVFYLSLLVGLSLVATVILLTIFSYMLLWQAENEVYKSQFESLTEDIYSGIESSVKRVEVAAKSMGQFVGHAHPHIYNWPNASTQGYYAMNDNMNDMSNVRVTLAPIVWPDDVSSFEAYAKEVFAADSELPDDAGMSPFGFGVFSLNSNSERYHDTTGESNHSEYDVLVPILLSAFPSSTKAMLYNLHSEPIRGAAIDRVYECVQAGNSSCSHLTDIIQHISDESYRPNSLLFSPVMPYHNSSAIVGYTIAAFNWDSLFVELLPDKIDQVDCVISTQTQQYTFRLHRDKAVLKGSGDLHDKKFDPMKREMQVKIDTDSLDSTTYTMLIYPTHAFYDKYHTSTPLAVSAVSLAVVAFTTILFFVYDRVSKDENSQKDQVLQAKRQFVRFVSHEIRTPLNTAKMGLRLVHEVLSESTLKTKGNSEDEVDEYCQPCAKCDELSSLINDIQCSTDTAVSVLNDLLQYDKIEAGKLKIEVKPVAIWELLRSIVDSFKLQAIEAGVVIAFDCEAFYAYHSVSRRNYLSSLHVMGDFIRLSQAVRNLISNALKFSPRGEVVRVSAKWVEHGLLSKKALTEENANREAKQSGSVLISVADSGPGILLEDQARLFNEGTQLNANTLQMGNGSGLGLWITKGIITIHNGQIWVSSEGVGLGSTFYIELPLVELTTLSQEASQKGPVVPPAVPSSCDRVINSGMRVLVVDDAASNRKLLCRLLTKRGYVCDEAEDGAECVRIMKSDAAYRYECILMDYQMPHMNGPEATQMIRSLGFKSLKIVGVTGNVMPDDVLYFINCGADTVLGKPIDITKFDNIMSTTVTIPEHGRIEL